MNCINGNKVNKISEFILLHDMINPSKRTKDINSHYYPILHVCVNTQKGKENFNNFRILLDSGCSFTIVMISLIENLKPKKTL